MKKPGKYILLTLLSLFLGVLVLMLAYPFWLMQATPKPKQPELSQEESIFFGKLENELNVQVERRFNNTQDHINPLEIDTSARYVYSVYIYTDSLFLANYVKDSTARSQSYNLKLANFINYNILNNSKKLVNIFINWQYKDQDYSKFLFDIDPINDLITQINNRNDMTE